MKFNLFCKIKLLCAIYIIEFVQEVPKSIKTFPGLYLKELSKLKDLVNSFWEIKHREIKLKAPYYCYKQITTYRTFVLTFSIFSLSTSKS